MSELSSFGKSVLKQLGGSPNQVKLSRVVTERWALDRPESILNPVPDELAQKILALPEETLGISEDTLEKQVVPSRQDRRVRIRFWEEYERAASEQRKMYLGNVVQDTGFPSWESYAVRVEDRPELLLWLMSPPPGYQIQLKEAMEIGMSKLLEILELPLRDGVTGKINTSVGLLQLQAFKMIDTRLHGAVTQRMVSVNVNAEKPKDAVALNMDEIEKKLKQLENDVGDVINGSGAKKLEEVREVKAEVVDSD